MADNSGARLRMLAAPGRRRTGYDPQIAPGLSDVGRKNLRTARARSPFQDHRFPDVGRSRNDASARPPEISRLKSSVAGFKLRHESLAAASGAGGLAAVLADGRIHSGCD